MEDVKSQYKSLQWRREGNLVQGFKKVVVLAVLKEWAFNAEQMIQRVTYCIITHEKQEAIL